MANGTGNDLVPGGYQPDFGSVDLAISPDLERLGRYRGPYNALNPMGLPIAPIDSEMRPVGASRFDVAFGDSIAAQQINNRRIWGGVGPQYNAVEPFPFDVWHTAGVGDPPSRILQRAQYLLNQNPDYFRGKNVFAPIGSNDTREMSAVEDYLNLLKKNEAANVVVPGLGPGVRNSAVANKTLKRLVEGAGFTFFAPQVQWAADGV